MPESQEAVSINADAETISDSSNQNPKYIENFADESFFSTASPKTRSPIRGRTPVSASDTSSQTLYPTQRTIEPEQNNERVSLENIPKTIKKSKSLILNNQSPFNDIDFDDEIVLRRVITEDGKSKAYINDIAVGQTFLNRVGEELVEIHGQHDQNNLLNSTSHMGILDQFGNLTKQKKIVSDIYKKMSEINDKLVKLKDEKI